MQKSRVVVLRCDTYDDASVYETVKRGLEAIIHIDERVLLRDCPFLTHYATIFQYIES